ncbi:heavy metal-associated isoprenylated plant protein 21-like isoform X1 [Arachis duranensis]|uniref:Heavy metal-associated isoprenylated plant protein 21-like isoform X1 n=2 Tax=Arachis duranensis TaxID=130453 RepID=A0A6P4D5T7_ARADU|nr:heavy metal-associated isoprenylated plant protein 21-like isoform X1 [Arachis duranensis]XP_057757996.1 heavy metal-associated isoprenylated plant protein 21-like isoform X1 [Arachis stenosperma]
MGALDYIFYFCTVPTTKRKLKSMQTVEIKVKMDCDGCERKVRNAVATMRGVKSVNINRKESKVSVNGYVDANKVLKRVKETGKKRAEFWPYVPQHVVTYPHASGVYDKRAPPNCVRTSQTFPTSSQDTQDQLLNFFNEDNVNSCSIM